MEAKLGAWSSVVAAVMVVLLGVPGCAKPRPPRTVRTVAEAWTGAGRMQWQGRWQVVGLAGSRMYIGPDFTDVEEPRVVAAGGGIVLTNLRRVAEITSTDAFGGKWLLADPVPGSGGSTTGLFRSTSSLQSFEPIAMYPGTGIALPSAGAYAVQRVCDIAAIEGLASGPRLFATAVLCRSDPTDNVNCTWALFQVNLSREGTEWSVDPRQWYHPGRDFHPLPEQAYCPAIATAPGPGYTQHYVAATHRGRYAVDFFLWNDLPAGPVDRIDRPTAPTNRDFAMVHYDPKDYYVAVLKAQRGGGTAGSLELILMVSQPRSARTIETSIGVAGVSGNARFIGLVDEPNGNGEHEVFVFDPDGIRAHPYAFEGD